MNRIQAIGPGPVFLIFTATAAPILAGVYLVLPLLLERNVPFFIGYLLCFQTVPFMFIFALALFLYRAEGNRFAWSEFKARMRLRFDGKIILYGTVLFAAGLAAYLLLQPVTVFLAKTALFAPPPWFGPDLHPLKPGTTGSFMGMPLAGAYWAPPVYLAGWFFNITGEELLFRGYLMPRMELRFGRYAWLVNGAGWWAWHCFWRWQMAALMPFIFLLPLAAQKTRSTVPGMIAHGAMNLIAVVMIGIGVLRASS